MESLLNRVVSPEDIKHMSPGELRLLARDIRRFLVHSVSQTGGHLASNLGVVELTLALHASYNSPQDKIVWDVGHQAYVHKMLTGRKEGFDTLRQLDGLSGFPKRSESPHDAFAAGHSSTSISAALGLAKARDLKGENNAVIAVIGDGSMTGGMAFEGMNNAGRAGTNLLVVLNDNQMSISNNVGALSRHLNDLRTRPGYLGAKESVHSMLDKLPGIGETLSQAIFRVKERIKYMVVPGVFFEELGFQYIGPVDGHDVEALMGAFTKAKALKGPVLIHAQTVKGKGYPPAEQNPCSFHGIGVFDESTGKTAPANGKPSWSQVFGDTMVDMGKENPNILAITAAMGDGTGLCDFAKAYPERFFDVGIAEQHAVTFAAGLAVGGFHPVFAVYSTFLQRGYDQLVHDVCMQNLPVTFAIDRAGVVGADGETHQGVFDIAYLSHIPNMTILAPKDGAELGAMLKTAVSMDCPTAIRYPRGTASTIRNEVAPLVFGKAEVLQDGKGIAIFAAGDMVSTALKVAESLRQEGKAPMVVNARWLKPFDRELIRNIADTCTHLVTLEDHVLTGGFGQAVTCFVQEQGLDLKCLNLAFPDVYIPQGSQAQLFAKYGLDAQSILEKIQKFEG